MKFLIFALMTSAIVASADTVYVEPEQGYAKLNVYVAGPDERADKTIFFMDSAGYADCTLYVYPEPGYADTSIHIITSDAAYADISVKEVNSADYADIKVFVDSAPGLHKGPMRVRGGLALTTY
ncbi:MAG: hypothetical protein EOP04_11330 [Proteobacteria bacterium]|nr:MAG: hypothetical protein EOP04_11330 [Pseudomonadota bacterium]